MKLSCVVLISLALLSCTFSQIVFPIKTKPQPDQNRRMLGDDGPPITFPLPNSLFIDVQIGTPPQNISALIDTGFGYFMISPTVCSLPSDEVYNITASKTANNTGNMTTIPYYLSDHPESTVIFNDTITIGGYPIANSSFLLTQESCSEPIFGFGVRNYSGVNIRTLAESLAKQQNTEQIVSLYLPANNSGSSFILGGYDDSIAPNGFVYHNSSSSDLWSLNITDFGLGNISYMNNATQNPMQGFLTSRWNTINAVPPVFSSLIKALPSSVACSKIGDYPNFYFVVDNVIYEVPPTAYFANTSSDAQTCSLAITTVTEDITIEDNQIFLGLPFFSAYYTSFDIKHGQIGLAPIKQGPIPLAGSNLQMTSIIFCLLISIIYLHF